MGSYAEFAAVPTWKLASLPDSVDFRAGAAIMLQGMTGTLSDNKHVSAEIRPDRIGARRCRRCRSAADSDREEIGARVIATVGTAAKGELARAAGAHEIIIYSQQDFEAEVKKMTNGPGRRSRLLTRSAPRHGKRV
jgi:NADPH2:quinone reductase